MSESFDGAQDERRGFDIIEYFPIILRLSKHSESFFSNLLDRSLPNHSVVHTINQQSRWGTRFVHATAAWNVS